MVLALAEAGKNLKSMSGGPFGACIVKDGKVISIARNTVFAKKDATCHAEINAIRIASGKLRDLYLSGCTIYSTTEPCPMCYGAIHWAGIDHIIYGTTIKDVKKLGFNELLISNSLLKRLAGDRHIRFTKGFLKPKCALLLRLWDKLPNKRTY